MPLFYTMFCYVTLGPPFGTLRKYCKYHASGFSGVFRDPLGHSWCILGSPGLSLEPLWGLPGHSPEPLWGLLGPPRNSQVTPWVLPATPPGLPGTLPGLPVDSRGSPGTPRGPLGLSRDSLGTPPGLPGGRRCGFQVVRLRPVGVPPGSHMSIDTYRAHRSCWTSGREVLHR